MTADPDAVMVSRVLAASDQPLTTELLVSAANAYAALRSSRERAVNPTAATARDLAQRLNPKQWEALRLLADGHTHATIGRQTGMASRSVRMLLSRAYGQLGARNGVHAVAMLARVGLLPESRR